MVGIAYLDEGSVTVGAGVTFELGPAGPGGRAYTDAPRAPPEGPPGEVHEMFRFPEQQAGSAFKFGQVDGGRQGASPDERTSTRT
jgi:hypothetical protein